MTIHHAEKKQPTIDDDIEDTYDAIPEQIIENRKKVSAAQKDKGKWKKKVQHRLHGSSGESRKRSKDTETFGEKFGIQMIADPFGDEWHKPILDIFGVQQIVALFGYAVL